MKYIDFCGCDGKEGGCIVNDALNKVVRSLPPELQKMTNIDKAEVFTLLAKHYTKLERSL